MNKQLDLQALAWQVAQARVPCPHLNLSAGTKKTIAYPCRICGGTGEVGEVLRFPQLSQECSWSNLHKEYLAGKAHATYDPDKCYKCRGTGRVPIAPDAIKLLDSMVSAGFSYELEADSSGVIIRFYNDDKSRTVVDDFIERLDIELLYRGAVKAMEASHAS